MARKPWNTTVDEEIIKRFKSKLVLNGIPINVALETLMKAYIKGYIEIEVNPKIIKERVYTDEGNFN
jgi:hypothetical protein